MWNAAVYLLLAVSLVLLGYSNEAHFKLSFFHSHFFDAPYNILGTRHLWIGYLQKPAKHVPHYIATKPFSRYAQ